MKKFLQFSLALTFVLAFSNAFALKQVKVDSILSPVTGSSIHANYPVDYKFVVKNTGDENILATDTIYWSFIQWNGTQWVIHTPVYYRFKAGGMAPNDTFHIVFRLTVNATSPAQIGLGFVASLTLKIADFQGKGAVYNLTVGMEEGITNLEKIWYNSGNLNIALSGGNNEVVQAIISNLNGQILRTERISLSGGAVNQMATGDLPKGIYILNLRTGNGTSLSKKFVVQ